MSNTQTKQRRLVVVSCMIGFLCGIVGLLAFEYFSLKRQSNLSLKSLLFLDGSTSSWRSYAPRAIGIEFKLPPNWSRFRGHGGNYFAPNDTQSYTLLFEYVADGIDDITNFNPDDKSITYVKYTIIDDLEKINDNFVTRVVSTDNQNNPEYIRQTFFEIDNRVWKLSAFSRDLAEIYRMDDLYFKILSTFKPIPKN